MDKKAKLGIPTTLKDVESLKMSVIWSNSVAINHKLEMDGVRRYVYDIFGPDKSLDYF